MKQPFIWKGQLLCPESKLEWGFEHSTTCNWSLVTADSMDGDSAGREPVENHMHFLRTNPEVNVTGYRWPEDFRWVAYNIAVAQKYKEDGYVDPASIA